MVRSTILVLIAFTWAASQGLAQDDPMANKGIGPIKSVEIADEVDEELADQGGKVFEQFCSSCHKMAEKYVGPALGGVTRKQSPEWIMNMIINPDVMIKEDPVAKALLAEFLTTMPNQNISEDDARAVLEHFRQYDEENEDAGEESSDEPKLPY